jgi:hypothetical protein
MTQTTSPAPQQQDACSCPSDGSGSVVQEAPILAADVDADLSGIQANADLLGHDLADVSINLGAVGGVLGLVDSVLDTGLGLVDAGTDVVDDLV